MRTNPASGIHLRSLSRLLQPARPAWKNVRYLPALFTIGAILFLNAGCADDNKQPTTRPMTMQEKQDALLHDPMGTQLVHEKRDVSGGDLKTFDKGAFKKDLDDVLNP
jgi:hypothetical protein